MISNMVMSEGSYVMLPAGRPRHPFPWAEATAAATRRRKTVMEEECLAEKKEQVQREGEYIHSIHGVWCGRAAGPDDASPSLKGRFWIHSAESDDEDDDSTAQIVIDAVEAGYSFEDLVPTVDQLVPASDAARSQVRDLSLNAGLPETKKIHELVASRKKTPMKPWKGPLPKPRCSPMRTLGSFLPKDLVHNLESSPEKAFPSEEAWAKSTINQRMQDPLLPFLTDSNSSGADPVPGWSHKSDNCVNQDIWRGFTISQDSSAYIFIYLHHHVFTSSEEINLQQMNRVCLHASTTWQQLVSIQDFDNELQLP
jgi:hypothetical protein